MRILVPLKPVVDPEHCRRVRTKRDGRELDLSDLPLVTNPFDECALEAALRLTEDGRDTRTRRGEVVAVSFGAAAAETSLRWALSVGATDAIHVDTLDVHLDAKLLAHALARLASNCGIDLVLMGKQSSDSDGQEVGPRLAAILGWPQVMGAHCIEQLRQDQLHVAQLSAEFRHTYVVELPAVVGVELGITASGVIRSIHGSSDPNDQAGIRFASLPSILAARRKEMMTYQLCDLTADTTPALRYEGYESVRDRERCEMLGSTLELVQRLAQTVHGRAPCE